MNVVNVTPCEDGDACTTGDVGSEGRCAGGAPPECDDNNPCTDDSCEATGGCMNVVNATPCDDGDACTTTYACVDGTCAGL